jgi:signal transduction histidine kinase
MGQCNVQISLARLHREAGNLSQARKEIEKALRIAEKINAPPLLAKGLTEQGIILFELNELDEAQQIFSQAKEWYAAQQNIFGLIQSSIQSGRVSKARGRMDEALAIFRQALALCEQNRDKHAGAAILFELATLDTPEIHSPDRRQYLLAALDSAEQLNDRPLLKKICETLSDHYEKESRFDMALDFYKKAQHLSAEMNVAEIASRIQNIEISRRMELLEREKKLLEMEKMAALGQLTAGVAHEINNPVNFVASNISPVRKNIEDILGVLHRCEEIINEFSSEEKKAELKQLRSDYDLDYSIEEIDRLLKGIENGASRIREIVAGLRTFTHPDEEEFKAADIPEGINAAITLLSSRMRNSITTEKQFGDVPPFEHYPSLLNQAFMHILLNAAEAIDHNGIITIKTFKEDSRIAIEISDTGKGMTDDVKRKMFNPFYTTKDVGEGTGLGLALTRNIIEKHHGKIEVLSEKGKGTTVRLSLPGVLTDSLQ